MKKKFFLLFTIFLNISIISISCTEKQFDPTDPEKSFAIAKEPYDDESYDQAVIKLGEFKARFPYSKYAAEATLLIAHSHFYSENYAEAAAAYEQFVKLHPKHASVELAMYRIGESYWLDAPEEIDREQEFTAKALTEWQKLVDTGSKSEHATKAKENIAIGKRRIAESEEFVAKYYCKQEIWHACAYRFIRLADNYPEFLDLRKNAVLKAADALEKLAEIKREDPKSDSNLYFKTMTADEIKQKAVSLRQKGDAVKVP